MKSHLRGIEAALMRSAQRARERAIATGTRLVVSRNGVLEFIPPDRLAHQLVDSLPETADWDDLIEKARYLAAIQRGIEAADQGDFASAERVRAMFAKWGVDVEG